MADWKIARKGGACGACERSFDEGEAHLSLLVLRADEPLREDLCQTCFEVRAEPDAVAEGQPDAGADTLELWWWRTRYRGEKKRGLALNLEAIEGLFLALEARAGEARTSTLSELRYILCLILMRKRRLKIERIVRDRDGEAMIVRRPRRKEALRVAVHDFTPQRTEELRAKLVRLFDGDEADLEALDRDEPEVETEDSLEDGVDGEPEVTEELEPENEPEDEPERAASDGEPPAGEDLSRAEAPPVTRT